MKTLALSYPKIQMILTFSITLLEIWWAMVSVTKYTILRSASMMATIAVAQPTKRTAFALTSNIKKS